MKKFFLLIITYFTFSTSFADNSISNLNNYFFIGKMDSYDNAFTLFFKTRKKSILARGENSNYITDFPQDLYIYIHETKKEFPLKRKIH